MVSSLHFNGGFFCCRYVYNNTNRIVDRKEDKEEVKTCCICKEEFIGYGHNPLPLYNSEGRCCTVCNFTQVLPARLILKNK
tara:strand:- start:478 stop:720 length:243 start_codon:yes stop_codon:yes gene_type:complete